MPISPEAKMSQTTPTAKKAGRNEMLETIVVVVEALVIALVFRTFIYQPFSIPSASMQSTMMIGDYFVADKFIWGFGPHSFPIPLPFHGRILGRDPSQGDIAVFFNEASGQDYIKTVVGMPGDHLQMKEGRLWINGKLIDRQFVADGVDDDGTSDQKGTPVPVKIYKETLPNGVVHTIQEISDDGPLDNTDEYVVPPGHFFMMGNNRDRSSDSRVLSDVGYVPAEDLEGKAEYRFFSIKGDSPPWQFWNWPASVQLNRMFQSVYQ
jgi:signal peptidase I